MSIGDFAKCGWIAIAKNVVDRDNQDVSRPPLLFQLKLITLAICMAERLRRSANLSPDW